MEAYSIGMVVLDELEHRRVKMDVKILGTDVSDEALSTARKGNYIISKWKIDNYHQMLNKYTEKYPHNRFKVGEQLKKIIFFKKHDLGVKVKKGFLFELVICDHVFQYYPDDAQLYFLKNLLEAVREGCFIYISTPSTNVRWEIYHNYPFERVNKNLYKKHICHNVANEK